jgi:hypothetical protein
MPRIIRGQIVVAQGINPFEASAQLFTQEFMGEKQVAGRKLAYCN